MDVDGHRPVEASVAPMNSRRSTSVFVSGRANLNCFHLISVSLAKNDITMDTHGHATHNPRKYNMPQANYLPHTLTCSLLDCARGMRIVSFLSTLSYWEINQADVSRTSKKGSHLNRPKLQAHAWSGSNPQGRFGPAVPTERF